MRRFPLSVIAASLLVIARASGQALAAECEYPEKPPKGAHLWGFSFRVENFTRQDARVVIRQGDRVVVDRVAPGDWIEHPVNDGEPFVREVDGRLDDRVNDVDVEAKLTDGARLLRKFSISGFSKSTDMDFHIQIRREGLSLRQDYDRFTGETSSEPSDPTFGFPATREEFRKQEAERRIFASCATLYVFNRADHPVSLRVTANGQALFDGVLDPSDPRFEGHFMAKEYFLGSMSLPERRPSRSKTSFVLDPSIRNLQVEETSVHTTWTLPLTTLWSGAREAEFGAIGVMIDASGPSLVVADLR